MLSGRTPFAADNTDAVFYQLANLPPPPLAKHAPALPSAIETVLLRALSKRAIDRYASMREFARALEMAAPGSCSNFTPVPLERASTLASCAAAASKDAAPDAMLDRLPRRLRGPKLRAALASAAIMLVVTAGGVLFAGARSGGTTAKTPYPSDIPRVPVVLVRPAVTWVEPKEPAASARDLPKPAVRERTHSLAGSQTSHPRASKSRDRRSGKHATARPVGTRPMFEEL
jgi:hypothetical protein